jgi:hypothetical protein
VTSLGDGQTEDINALAIVTAQLPVSSVGVKWKQGVRSVPGWIGRDRQAFVNMMMNIHMP